MQKVCGIHDSLWRIETFTWQQPIQPEPNTQLHFLVINICSGVKKKDAMD